VKCNKKKPARDAIELLPGLHYNFNVPGLAPAIFNEVKQ
jgi:hypothetical protein